MADKPILFSAPMIRALLAGTKTQTRRALKPKKHACLISDGWADSYVLDPGNADWLAQYCKFKPGDRLWVRESWGWSGFASMPPSANRPQFVEYKATGPRDMKEIFPNLRGDLQNRAPIWKPSIHMPRWASRLTLIVTDIRVQRLQDISKEDVMAEGISEREGCPLQDCHAGWHEPYAQLWNAINGAGGWERNPWVAAYSFEVHRCNIDKMEPR